MKDLLIKAQGLVDDLNTEVQSAKEKNAEANQLAASARIQKNKLDAKEIDISNREREVAAGEKPGKSVAEASRIKAENAVLATKIEESKQDFERKKKDFTVEVARERAELNKAQAELNNTRENFKIQAEALAEKEKKLETKLKELGLKLA